MTSTWLGSTAVVTGGSGYVGFRLAQALCERGCTVVLLDLAPPPCPLPPGISHVCASVADVASVAECLAGAEVVFHVASYGMSGREQLDRRRVESVNLGGTAGVLKAAADAGVRTLVYVSTYNSVFGGQAVLGGDESLPRYSVHRHVDHYSRTKTLAEAAVLGADRIDGLRTCAVRPAGIWGPGEQRHLPRVARYMAAGLYKFTFADRHGGLVDFIHVDNLVQGLLLAAEGCTSARGYVAAGSAYFLSDGAPTPNFAFFTEIGRGLGYPTPRLRLPLWVVYYTALLMELTHAAVGRWWDFEPILVRAEVLKAGVSHHFSVGKARRELKYVPQAHSVDEAVQWLLDHGYGSREGRCLPWRAAAVVCLGILMAWAAMHYVAKRTRP